VQVSGFLCFCASRNLEAKECRGWVPWLYISLGRSESLWVTDVSDEIGEEFASFFSSSLATQTLLRFLARLPD
jgi:hypothetical protein